jgi:hypothetical protein
LVFDRNYRLKKAGAPANPFPKILQGHSVSTTEFVTLTVTHFVEKPLKVLHSFAFWN